MLGSCFYLFDSRARCNRTYNLHTILFRNPESPSFIEQVDLCKPHYEEIIGQMTEYVRQFQMDLTNLISKSARDRKIARENGIYRSNDFVYKKIEDLKALIKRTQNDECKNFLCRQNLRDLDMSRKLFSVHTFKQSGRRHYSFYFCSLKCYNFMKARCGLPVAILKGQTTL